VTPLLGYLRRHRDALAVGLSAAIAVAAVTGTRILIVQAVRDDGSQATSTQPPRPAAVVPLPAAADGGQLRIVESGFSPLTDVAGEPMVTWGLIVENTSQVTAAMVGVSVDILDAGGRSLVPETSDYAKSRGISRIMPGQRAGIGDAVYVTGPGVASVSFHLGDPQWLPTGMLQIPVAPLAASQVETSRYMGSGTVPYWDENGIRILSDDQGLLRITFRVESGYDSILGDPSAQAIFRNAQGAIVGGTAPGDTDAWAIFPPGWSNQRIDVRDGPPATADLSRTEVYPYPSCC